MLVSIFVSALFWNILTWAFGIPNSSSHCIIGALVGVAAADALMRSRGLGQGVDWGEIITVIEGLALSPGARLRAGGRAVSPAASHPSAKATCSSRRRRASRRSGGCAAYSS